MQEGARRGNLRPMCELFALSSRNPTVATFSLDVFARHGGLEGSATDGWGLVFYDGRDLRLYREPEAAARSRWVGFIASARLPSRLILSHIRRATNGGAALANTAPFVRELFGRMHAFAHNGRLDGLARSDARRFQPVGETDSELAFCLLLERIARLSGGDGLPPLEHRLAEVARFAAELRPLGPANFLYADGDALFAHGHRRTQQDGRIAAPGLWRLERECACDRDGLAAAGVALVGEAQEVALVASVPLTKENWVPLDEGEVVAVRNGRVKKRASFPREIENKNRAPHRARA
jgi:predicted glutamine amidotransferase